MQIALVADPHVSLTDRPHKNIRLIDTPAITATIVADLEQRRPDLAIWMGDLTHDGSPEVRARFKTLVRPLTVPCLWMLGNHDVEYVTKQQFATEVMPCAGPLTMRLGGWDVVILDTVPELSPRNPIGEWRDADRRLLRESAASSQGPLLVIAHHPMRARYMDMDTFWRDTAGYTGLGVFVGGHSHRDLYTCEHGWHLLDVSSCCRRPQGYHWLELSPTGMAIDFIPLTAPLTGPEPSEWAADEPIFPLRFSIERNSPHSAS